MLHKECSILRFRLFDKRLMLEHTTSLQLIASIGDSKTLEDKCGFLHVVAESASILSYTRLLVYSGYSELSEDNSEH